LNVVVHRLSDDQPIRRFVELPKLFELLLAGRTFFPNLQTLRSVDPFECGISLPQATRDLRRRALESEAISLMRYLPQEYQSGDRVEDYQQTERLLKKTKIAALREHVAEMRLFLLRHRMVCNCWHLSDGESDAMWKLYGGGVGVMLVSTVARLQAAIKGRYSRVFCDPNPQEYSLAPVRYVDEKDLSRLPRFYSERPWLLKRASFAHEREIRVSHELPWMMIDFEEGGMMIDMDPQELISQSLITFQSGLGRPAASHSHQSLV
jgi:hypothetical protein